MPRIRAIRDRAYNAACAARGPTQWIAFSADIHLDFANGREAWGRRVQETTRLGETLSIAVTRIGATTK
jgi:hypothetical protein